MRSSPGIPSIASRSRSAWSIARRGLLAVALELPARGVDGRDQQRRRARGLLELEDQLEPGGVDAVALDAEHRGLPEAVERLVHAADGKVGARLERRRRQ